MQSKISKKLTYNFGGSLLQGIPNILNGVTQSITAEDSQRGQAIGSTIGSAADLAMNAIPGVGPILSQLGLGKLAGGLIGNAVQGEQPKNIITKPNTNPYGYSNGGNLKGIDPKLQQQIENALKKGMTAFQLDSYNQSNPLDINRNRKKEIPLENLLELFDPTGVSSHDDRKRFIEEYGNSASSLELFLNDLQVVPLLGKLKYLNQGSKVASVANKGIHAVNMSTLGVNTANRVDNIKDLTGEGLSSNKDNPVNFQKQNLALENAPKVTLPEINQDEIDFELARLKAKKKKKDELSKKEKEYLANPRNNIPQEYSNGGKMVEGLSLFNGLPHSQGGLTINDKGIPSLNGKHEVEKKEVKWLDYIFSDKLKIK